MCGLSAVLCGVRATPHCCNVHIFSELRRFCAVCGLFPTFPVFCPFWGKKVVATQQAQCRDVASEVSGTLWQKCRGRCVRYVGTCFLVVFVCQHANQKISFLYSVAEIFWPHIAVSHKRVIYHIYFFLAANLLRFFHTCKSIIK